MSFWIVLVKQLAFLLIHFQAKPAYAQSEIERTLEPYLPKREQVAVAVNPQPEKAATIEGPESEQVAVATNIQSSEIAMVSDVEPNEPQSCPKCQSYLVKRVAKKGKNAGNKFIACSAYPKCRFVLKV